MLKAQIWCPYPTSSIRIMIDVAIFILKIRKTKKEQKWSRKKKVCGATENAKHEWKC